MATLTRIKNNQIADSTIYANAKIINGSIVGSLFNSNITTTSNFTITGNLTVLGAATYVTIAATNTFINDPLIVLNNGFSSSPTYDLGFIFNRGSSLATSLIWSESAQEFRLTFTTESGTSLTSPTNVSSYANLHIGNLIVDYTSSFGNLNITSGNVNAYQMQLSGNAAINGGSLTTTAPTFNLINTTVANINFGGSATTINVGASSSSINLNGANIYLPNMTTVYAAQTAVTVFNTPQTVNMFGGATLANLGAGTGTLIINNPNVNGSQPTQNLYNTANTTQINFGGSATLLNVGANSGTLVIGNPNVNGTQATQNLYNTSNTTTMNLGGFVTLGNIGAGTGTLVINNPNINGSQPTQNLYNTANTATMNFAGAAVDITIGSTSGTANIRNGNIWFQNATNVGSGQASVTVFTTPTTINAFTSATLANIGAGTGTLVINNPNVNGSQPTQNLYNTANTTTMNLGGFVTLGNIGAGTGTLVINNPNINGSQPTQNLYNTANTATMNFAGSATNITIGATSGTANIQNGNIWFQNATIVGGGQPAIALFNSPVTVNAFGNATLSNIGASTGTMVINPPNINGSQPTQNLYNTANTTTMNLGGFVTLANIGAGTGTLVINNPNVNGSQPTQNLYNTANTTTMNLGGFVTLGNIGAGTGTLVINNPNINGSQPTQNLYNTANTTTLNLGGFVTLGNIGAGTGTLVINNPNVNGSQATQYLYNTANTTAMFFAGNVNSLTIGTTSGTVLINNPNVNGSQATQNLYNTANTTTMNFAGAATDITIGSSTGGGTANIRTGNLWLPNTTTITTQQSSLTFANTTTTYLGIGGATNMINMGGINGWTNLQGNLVVNQPINATGGYNTGALVVKGGASFVKDVWIGGNLYVANLISTITQTLVIQDPLVYLTANATYPYSYDIGFYSAFTGGPSNVYAHTGLVRNDADGVWYLFSNIGEPSGGQISLSGAIYDQLTLGNILIKTNTGIVTDQLMANVFNTSAQFVNMGGAATDITIGATSGTANVQNGNIWFQNATVVGSGQAAIALFNRPATVNAFGNATLSNIGASTGTMVINPPNINGSQPTQYLYNTANTTTMNFAGSAVDITIGSTSGTANIQNGNIWFQNATIVGSGQAAIALFNRPATVNAFGNATLSNIGASTGTMVINPPNINGSQPTQNLYNTANTTTMNLGGFVTLGNIGAGTGTLVINNPSVNGSQPTQNLYNTANTTQINFGGSATLLNVGANSGTFVIGNPNVNGTQATQNLYNTANTTTMNLGGFVTLGNIGAGTGTLVINNPNINGSQATQNLYNTANTTTMNFAGSAVDITIGSTSGTANVQNGNIWFQNATIVGSGQAAIALFNRPATVNAFGNATLSNIGASTGTMVINPPNINGSQPTQYLYNTANTTTMFFAGAATLATIGSTSGTLVLNNPNVNGTQVTQNLYNTANTATMNFAGAAVDITIGATNGTANIQNGNIWFQNATIVGSGQAAIALFNRPATVNAFGNATLSNIGASTGTMVINNPNINGSQPTQYLYNTANTTTMFFAGNVTNMTIGSATGGGTANIMNTNISFPFATTISGSQPTISIFATPTTINEFTSATIVNHGAPTGNTTINHTLAVLGAIYGNSTSISTGIDNGAMVIQGGVGLGSNLWVSNGAVINASQTVDNFRVQGVYANTVIFCNSISGGTVIGGSNTAIPGATTLKINGTDAMILPVGGTQQRPDQVGSAANVAVAGMIRFNSDSKLLEYHDGANWQYTQGSFTVASSDQFNGDNFSNVFVLGSASTTEGTIVSINGVVQAPTLAYSVIGNVLTLSEAPVDGDIIECRRILTTSTVSAIATGFSAYTVDSVTANISTGTSSSIVRVIVDSGGNVNLVNGSALTYAQTGITVPTSPVVVDVFDKNMYRAAKFIATAQNTTATQFEVTEILVVHDGTTAVLSEYGKLSTGNLVVTYTASISGNSVQLLATGISGSSNSVKVMPTYIVV